MHNNNMQDMDKVKGQRGRRQSVNAPPRHCRVTRLQSAMDVVGESDPGCPALLDALKRARVQARNRFVEEHIAATD